MQKVSLDINKKEDYILKYCNEDVGVCLFQDNLLNIERIELAGDVFRLFAKNTDISNNFIKKLDEYKNKDVFFNLVKIDNLLYSKDYLDFIEKCRIESVDKGSFCIRNGILDKGYLDKTSKVFYSRDLRASFEFSLIMKDFNFPVVCRGKEVYRSLGYIQSLFANNVVLKDKSLIIGLDLGYLFYRYKDYNYTIYVYDMDNEYVNFFKENIYSKMNSKLKVHFIKDLEYEDLKKLNVSNIVLDNTLHFEYLFKYFFDLELYRFLNILQTDSLEIILNKIKCDYRSIVMNDKETFCDALIENYKDFKGIECILTANELDLADKCEKFLEENKIFYTNYKKFIRDINNNDFIINILCNY